MSQRVLIDANFLITFTDNIPAQKDHPLNRIPDLRERIDFLFMKLEQNEAEIVIPAVALAETLAWVEIDAEKVVTLLEGNAHIRVAPFDMRAAREFGIRFKEVKAEKSFGDRQRTKIKFDAMIVSIALVEKVSLVYTNDGQLRGTLKNFGIASCSYDDLPVPIGVQPMLPLPVDVDSGKSLTA